MEPGLSPNADALLEHAGFVRAIARGLLRDSDAAEDVVQETMLAAVRKPPRDPDRLRAWMGTVARNLSLRTRRGKGRRARRELAAARAEGLPGTAEIAAQLDLQRRVVEEVEALDEPYRSVVVHRYFHAHTVREIAQSEGVSAKAIESRVARALKTLRARLDRPGLTGALAILAWPRSASAAAAAAGGALVVSTKSKVGLVVVALLLAGGGIAGLRLRDQEKAQPDRSGHARNESATREVSDEAPVAFAGAQPNAASRTPPPPAIWRKGVVTGRVGWTGQAVPEGTKLQLINPKQTKSSQVVVLETTANPDGTFRFEKVPKGSYALFMHAPGYAPWMSGYSTRVGPKKPSAKVSARLLKGATLRLTVRDSAGRRRRGLLIGVEGPKPIGVDISVSTNDEGVVELPNLAEGKLTLRFELANGGAQEWTLRLAGEGYSQFKRLVEREIVLDGLLDGTVRDPAGAPLAGMSVSIWDRAGFSARTKTDDQGRYRVRALQPGEYNLTATRTGLAVFGQVSVTAAPHTVHEIACNPGAIFGRIERASGVRARTSVSLSGPRSASIPMEGESEFAIWNVPAGRYKISAHAYQSGLSSPYQQLDLREREVRRDVVFAIDARRYGEVELEIRAKDGTLIERAQFFVELAQGSVSMAPKSHAPGRFRMRFEAGSRLIKIRCGRYGNADVRVEIEPDRSVFRNVQLK